PPGGRRGPVGGAAPPPRGRRGARHPRSRPGRCAARGPPAGEAGAQAVGEHHVVGQLTQPRGIGGHAALPQPAAEVGPVPGARLLPGAPRRRLVGTDHHPRGLLDVRRRRRRPGGRRSPAAVVEQQDPAAVRQHRLVARPHRHAAVVRDRVVDVHGGEQALHRQWSAHVTPGGRAPPAGPGTPRNPYGAGSRPGWTNQHSPGSPRSSTASIAAATSSAESSGKSPNCGFARAISGVSANPGHTAFTRIPSPASTGAAARTYPTTACLVIVYSASPGMGTSPASEAVATTVPPPARRSAGTAAVSPNTTWSTFTPTIRR